MPVSAACLPLDALPTYILIVDPPGSPPVYHAPGSLSVNHAVVDCGRGACLACCCAVLQARLGQHTWPVVRDLVDGVVTISDSEIVAAMKLLLERMKLVVEPSGAAGLAAVLSKDFATVLAGARAHAGARVAGAGDDLGSAHGASHLQQPEQLNIGIILCGGNLDFKDFWHLDNWQPTH